MKLATAELALGRTHGFYVTERCDGCKKLLNQTVHYTIAGKPQVYCSAACRDSAFFRDRSEAKKHATPGRCAYCSGSLKGKKRGSIFCDDTCRKGHSRKIQRITTAEVEKSRTPPQLNQRVASPKTVEQGNCIRGGPQPFSNARGGFPPNLGCRSKRDWQPRVAEVAKSPSLEGLPALELGVCSSSGKEKCWPTTGLNRNGGRERTGSVGSCPGIWASSSQACPPGTGL